MKFVLLASCLVACALAGAVYPGGVGGYGGYGGVGSVGGVGGVGVGGVGVGAVGGGVGAGSAGLAASNGVGKVKAFSGVRDVTLNQAQGQQWASDNQNYGRVNGAYGDDAARQDHKAQEANSKHGSKAVFRDDNNAASHKASAHDQANSFANNKWGNRKDGSRLLNNQVQAAGNQWYKGLRNNDDIDYAYDKKFNLNDNQNGGFEFAESSNSHALDDLRDAASGYDRNVDKNAQWASAADAQKASRQSAAAQSAKAADSNWDKFARHSANWNKANGRDKDYAQKIDQSQGANRLWTDARRTASDIYKDLATADGSYQKHEKDVAGKGAYGYGVAGKGGYGAIPGYGGPGPAAAAGGVVRVDGDSAQSWDQAAKTGLRNTEGAATNDQTRTSFAKDQWLNDQVRGFDRNQDARADDQGYSDWARNAAQSANKADSAAASAAKQWNKDARNDNFNEDLWKKENEKKRLSDRSQNKKVYKKYYDNKKHGGDNWERMTYDHDKANDAFGYDTNSKKNYDQRANSNVWSEAADANGRNAAAARQNAAANSHHETDSAKAANGFQSANAAHKNNNAASKHGFDNEVWKKDQAQKLQDQNVANAAQWGRDDARAGLNARSAGAVGAGAGAGAAVGGLGLGGGLVGGYGGYAAGNGGYGSYGASKGGYGGYGGYGAGNGGYGGYGAGKGFGGYGAANGGYGFGAYGQGKGYGY